jgi:hypothetical protein
VIALRHQLGVLKRQRPGRARLFCADRLLWVLLYRIWPRAIDAMILVKPTTVLQWHRRNFRLAWRWRSWARRPGRPRLASEVRGLIRQMCRAESAAGRPSDSRRAAQAWYRGESGHVGRYMPWRPKEPSPTWRSFLRTHMTDIAAVDMFGGFRRLCAGTTEPQRYLSNVTGRLQDHHGGQEKTLTGVATAPQGKSVRSPFWGGDPPKSGPPPASAHHPRRNRSGPCSADRRAVMYLDRGTLVPWRSLRSGFPP